MIKREGRRFVEVPDSSAGNHKPGYKPRPRNNGGKNDPSKRNPHKVPGCFWYRDQTFIPLLRIWNHNAGTMRLKFLLTQPKDPYAFLCECLGLKLESVTKEYKNEMMAFLKEVEPTWKNVQWREQNTDHKEEK